MVELPSTDVTADAAGPLVCYDGDCGLCRASVGLLARSGLVPRARLAPFQSFDAELAQLLLEANVHNELAVLAPETLEVRSGIDGLLWAFEGSWLSPLLGLTRPAPVRALLRVGYRLIAYNRRVLSPVRGGGIRCACDPDFHLGLRLGFIGLVLGLIALILWAAPLPPGAAAGGLVLMLAACLRRGPARLDAVAHAAWVTLLVTLAAVPYGLTGHPAWLGLPLLGLLGSAWRRSRAVGLHVAGAFGLAALSAAAAWIFGR